MFIMNKANFLIFFALNNLLFSVQGCTKFCNNNGICYIENEVEKCNCLDRIYVGESCEILVNHCDGNPCKNGGTCVLVPGQYNCLCFENAYDQNCTTKSQKNEKYFGQIFLQYNHVAPISKDNPFLIVLTDLGTVPSMIEMTTAEYAIAYLSFSSNNSRDFNTTNDIKSIAKKLNVPSTDLPAGNVFYYEGKYRMSTAGVELVSLKITEDENLRYIWNFQFGSIKNVGCNPSVSVTNCGTPKLSAYINANQAVFVEANIKRSCGRDSTMSYQWSISNFFDAKTLQTFNENSRSMNIPAFGIQNNYNEIDGVFSFFKVIKLVSLERSADGNRYGEVVNRCYIRIMSDEPIARISGGEYQEYSSKQTIMMDGSESVDLSLHAKMSQNLMYLWRCTSNDTDKFCDNLKKTGSQVISTTILLLFYFCFGILV